jgi:hypothetical protein
LVKFNKKLHESSLYNGFQITISALAAFTTGFAKGMKNPICFVAGTMILTTMGLKAIETIQAGDQVIATNTDTFQTGEKKVVETYINKTTCIVKIFIQNEEIYTTMNHPFYVKGQGFVAACKLTMGDEIMNASGGSYPVECVELEEKQEIVYNFQVEDYHTYYVGENSILVHNDCPEGDSPTQGVGNPVEVEGRGNTGRTTPNTLNEQMAMNQVQSNPLKGATKVPLEMNDARWPASEGWVKMQSVVQNTDGTKTAIHYVYNEITGAFDDFKFK